MHIRFLPTEHHTGKSPVLKTFSHSNAEHAVCTVNVFAGEEDTVAEGASAATLSVSRVENLVAATVWT